MIPSLGFSESERTFDVFQVCKAWVVIRPVQKVLGHFFTCLEIKVFILRHGYNDA